MNHYSRKVAAVKNLFSFVVASLANLENKMVTENDQGQLFDIKLSPATVYRIMNETADKVIPSAIILKTNIIYHTDGLKLLEVPFEII